LVCPGGSTSFRIDFVGLGSVGDLVFVVDLTKGCNDTAEHAETDKSSLFHDYVLGGSGKDGIN